ncbi:MAG TPA: Uma2 family endonuclease [Bryobacteraceae bacterium]|nr:Uma2 family endonuclease [Bryobacteraceae bacterium]
MDAPVLISEQEYLHSSYDPDCELVDGHLLERNAGEREHSILLGELDYCFRSRAKQWGLRAFPVQRVRVAAGRYRVPDLSIYKDPAPRDDVFAAPPFIAIEILSSEDRMSRVRRKIDDYLEFGVPYVWIIDPNTRKADVYTPGAIYEAKDLILRTEDPPIEVPLAELFQALDE